MSPQLKIYRILLIAAFSFLAASGFSQDRCGTVEVNQKLRNSKSLLETDDQFETWLRQRKTRANARSNASGTYVIPVVVHVIHKGEAVGSGTNISDAQVLSQINVLNKDYKRLNADASSTPLEFQSVAGSINIEFVLAKQSPEGLPSNGIKRVKGTKNQWTTDDNTTLKSLSYWPAESYLNIWVTDLSSSLLGYAQFPVSDLAGLEDAEDNRLTDGVVIDYSVFGSKADGTFSLLTNFSKGRTTTHEVGHFLGLRHIWGDDSGTCAGSDYVDDTPGQGNSTNGCPSQPQTSCGVHTMFQNYMDYTNDDCMNLFTIGQIDRMTTVLENSPRRASLLNSVGAFDPAPVANDLGVESIMSPLSIECAGATTPVFRIINKGINTVISATLSLSFNAVTPEVKTFTFAQALAPGEATSVSFSPLILASGLHTLTLQVLSTNDATDGKANDNRFSATTTVRQTTTLPLAEHFTSIPASWTVSNPDGKTSWQNVTAVKNDQPDRVMYMNYYNATEALGEKDILLTPTFSLAEATAPFLSFSIAYARYQNFTDGLAVYIITDCSENISHGTQVYFKEGSALATTSVASGAFNPTTESQWKQIPIDLHEYIGQAHVQVAFVGINGGGNNLYLDNIALTGALNENVSIVKLVSPAPVTCGNVAAPVLLVHNAGGSSISSLRVNYMLNNVAQAYATPDNFSLAPGADSEITLPATTLVNGLNTFSVQLASPNGFKDIDTLDNEITRTVEVNTAADIIPLRQNFDEAFETQWTSVNSSGGNSWKTVHSNYSQSLKVEASENIVDGDEAWLVSPTLDLSATAKASVFFDLSYAKKDGSGVDDLKLLASTDCGITYSHVLLDVKGSSLETTINTGVPTSAEDWKKYFVNLDALAGLQQVRLAWVFSNGNANSLYLDNIEFFISDNPTPQSADKPFVVYGTDPSGAKDFLVTFNLSDRQPVNYNLLDITGRQVDHGTFEDVLNQSYTLAPSNISKGIYFLRLQIGSEYFSTRIYLSD
jgi:hypothetical protein